LTMTALAFSMSIMLCALCLPVFTMTLGPSTFLASA
jgi:hypothetical protein